MAEPRPTAGSPRPLAAGCTRARSLRAQPWPKRAQLWRRPQPKKMVESRPGSGESSAQSLLKPRPTSGEAPSCSNRTPATAEPPHARHATNTVSGARATPETGCCQELATPPSWSMTHPDVHNAGRQRYACMAAARNRLRKATLETLPPSASDRNQVVVRAQRYYYLHRSKQLLLGSNQKRVMRERHENKGKLDLGRPPLSLCNLIADLLQRLGNLLRPWPHGLVICVSPHCPPRSRLVPQAP